MHSIPWPLRGSLYRSLARAILAIAAAALLGAAPAASADGWDLDGSFGSGGVAWLPELDSIAEARVDPEGRVVVIGRDAGRLAVARFTAAGAPDGSFGAGGVAMGPPQPVDNSADDGHGQSEGQTLDFDAEGRVIAAGVESVQVGTKFRRRWLVTRFTAQGDMDTSFSSGADATAGWELIGVPVDALGASVTGVVVQPGSNRIVVLGCLPDAALVWSRFALARLLPTGQRDTDFGDAADGVIQHTLTGQPADLGLCPGFATAEHADGSGDLIMAGAAAKGAGSEFWLGVARYAPDGQAGPDYAGGGTAVPNPALGWVFDGALEPDGGLSLVLGGSGTVSRFQSVAADGTPAAPRSLPVGWQAVNAMLRVGGGHVMTAGWVRPDPQLPPSWAVGRLNADLSPDESFAPGGQLVAQPTAGKGAIRDLEAVDGGHVVAAGGYFTPGNEGLARYAGPPPAKSPAPGPEAPPAPAPSPDPAPAPVPAPAPLHPPVSRLTGLKPTMRAGALKSIRGSAAGDVASVRVAVVRVRRGGGRVRCRRLRPSGRLAAPSGRRCTTGGWLPATGTTSFRYRLRGALPPGRYLIASVASDAAGNSESGTAANLRRVRLR